MKLDELDQAGGSLSSKASRNVVQRSIPQQVDKRKREESIQEGRDNERFDDQGDPIMGGSSPSGQLIGTGDVVRQMLSNMRPGEAPSMEGIQLRQPPGDDDDSLEIDINNLTIECRQSIEKKINVWVQEILSLIHISEPTRRS